MVTSFRYLQMHKYANASCAAHIVVVDVGVFSYFFNARKRGAGPADLERAAAAGRRTNLVVHNRKIVCFPFASE
jgi:hypothetical protein